MAHYSGSPPHATRVTVRIRGETAGPTVRIWSRAPLEPTQRGSVGRARQTAWKGTARGKPTDHLWRQRARFGRPTQIPHVALPPRRRTRESTIDGRLGQEERAVRVLAAGLDDDRRVAASPCRSPLPVHEPPPPSPPATHTTTSAELRRIAASASVEGAGTPEHRPGGRAGARASLRTPTDTPVECPKGPAVNATIYFRRRSI